MHRLTAVIWINLGSMRVTCESCDTESNDKLNRSNKDIGERYTYRLHCTSMAHSSAHTLTAPVQAYGGLSQFTASLQDDDFMITSQSHTVIATASVEGGERLDARA